MSGQNCKNYDVKRETAHCYPRSVDHCCTWLEVAWCCRWNLSVIFKISFCFVLLYNRSRNDWSLGERWILFPSNLNVSFDFVSGNKIHCSPRDQSLSVEYIQSFCRVAKTDWNGIDECRLSVICLRNNIFFWPLLSWHPLYLTALLRISSAPFC